MLEKIKKFLLYAMLDQDQFDKVRTLVADENGFSLRLAAIVQIAYFGLSFLGSMSFTEMADKKLVYGFGTVFPLVFVLIHLLFSKKHPSVQIWVIRYFSMGILITGLLCTLICTPDEMTILLLIFFFCIPMLFVVRPIELIIFVAVTDVIYFAAAVNVKSHDILTMDMIDVAIFSTLSVILGVSQMRGRFRRYWLETDAVDLAEIRYKAAFIDQLTGTYNRNAYNKDSEQIASSGLSSGFMFIALDLNGLKSANDSMGHVAGDELITGAADCMRKCFDEYGKVYRVGGDEFIVMLDTKGIPEGKILNDFNHLVDTWQGKLVKKLSVSYGVVIKKEIGNLSFREIELLADKRMYQVKSDYYKNAGAVRRT